MSALDKSLDDIIATKPRPIRRKRTTGAGGARAAILGNNTTPRSISNPTVATRAATTNGTTPAAQQNPAVQQQQSATKIIVSNLPADVNEAQIKELFGQTVGALREVNLNYDARGQSKGIAYVTFNKRGDGYKAWQEYNNRLIDGKRPMKIEIVLEPLKVAPPTLASRVAPAPARAVAAAAPAATTAVNGHTGGPSNRRGRGRGRGARRGGGRANRPEKSVADLDQEMEDYSTTQTAGAETAAAAA